MFKISEIVKVTNGKLERGDPERCISAVSTDTRSIKQGELFLAIRGNNFNGHDFLKEAIDREAGAVVVEKMDPDMIKNDLAVIKVKDTLKAYGDIAAFNRLRFDIPTVAITGSTGKTTTKEMASFMLDEDYNVLRNKGTENNLVGVPKTLLNLNEFHEAIVCELGTNHFGEIRRLSDILSPNIGIITNISQAHTEFFGDLKGVFKEKKSLLDSFSYGDIAILNGDDAFMSRIKDKKYKIIKFGTKEGCDYRATKMSFKNGYWEFLVNDIYPFKLGLLSKSNIYNALCAITLGFIFDLDYFTIQRRLADFKPPSMRMEVKDVNGVMIIDDTYNSNPMSCENAIMTLSEYRAPGKKIFVTADMLELGGRSPTLHRRLGKLVAQSDIDILITMGELSHHTYEAASRHGMKKEMMHDCDSINSVVGLLKELAGEGDVILVKGSRAMRMEEVIKCFTTSYIR